VIVPDVNMLVYAYDSTSTFNERSKAWWEASVSGGESIGLTWEVILGFLRLVTHPRVFTNPLAVNDALTIVESWLDQPSVTLLDPTHRHWPVLKQLLGTAQVGGKLVGDAHLAAIALEHRAQLITNDRDFERFAGVASHNPLGS
jgi:uncharacterized protein